MMDRSTIFWIAVALLAAVALGLAHLFGCAAPTVSCPLGTFPTRVDVQRRAEMSGGIVGDVPSKTGKLEGSWTGSGQAQWICVRICPPGTAVELHESARGKSVKCIDLNDPPPRKDGGQ